MLWFTILCFNGHENSTHLYYQLLIDKIDVAVINTSFFYTTEQKS